MTHRVHEPAEQGMAAFRTLADNSPHPVARFDGNLRLAYINEAWADVLGRRPADVVGQSLQGIGLPEALARAWDARLRGVFERGDILDVEDTLPTIHGARVFATRCVPEFSAPGTVRSVLTVSQDLTDRRLAEAALTQSVDQHRTILQTAMDGFWMADRQGRLLEVNESYCRMSGYTAAELLTMRIADLDALESDADVDAHNARIVAQGLDRFESRHRRKDGTEFDVEVSVQYREGSEGAFVGFQRDITDRKRSERELVQGHDLLVNLARLVPGVLYQYRLYPDGRSAFPYSSPGMNDIYEVTPEEVREDATPVFGRLHPDDHDRVAAAIFESANTLETFQCEFRVVLPRQGLRWRWSQAHPQRMEDGSTLWHGIITDSTARTLAEAEKARLEDKLQQAQKMESVGRLAGGVAHDFNNMLSVILGHAELLLRDVGPSSPLREDLEEVCTAARRSADLTRQLLAFARKQTVSPKVLDLNQTVGSMLSMLRRLIGEDIHLVWRLCATSAHVEIDPSQLDQILANLCVNARDAIAGVGTIEIEASVAVVDDARRARNPGAQAGEFVRLSITDSGSGMSDDVLAHLFEPFFTTKALGRGTGLGLSTVFGIVTQNRGFIEVRSSHGGGTTIDVFLPSVGPPREATEGEGASELLRRGHETVVLVEDEPALLALEARALEGQGYHVIAADTPAEAIGQAADFPGEIDLIVTDVIMPNMNGRDLAARLLSLQPRAQVLFTSGYTDDIIAPHGVLEQGTHFLQKPFSVNSLVATVRAVLDMGRA